MHSLWLIESREFGKWFDKPNANGDNPELFHHQGLMFGVKCDVHP
jgi:hypothetical protein